MSIDQQIHLTSTWFIKPGYQEQVFSALEQLAHDVQENEPDTLVYFVHRQCPSHTELISLPPMDPLSIVFFEVYRNKAAFLTHLYGPVFTNFVKQYGELFVQSNGQPFTFVDFLILHTGFARPAIYSNDDKNMMIPNQHPCVMFEILAKNQGDLKNFYQQVFGWQYLTGTEGFAYVIFNNYPMLGGIGQAENQAGETAGCNFYLKVNSLQTYLDKVVQAGGMQLLAPITIDGYRFAMFKDTEGNAVGLLEV